MFVGDDWLMDGGLNALILAMRRNVGVPFVYGSCFNYRQKNGDYSPVWVEPFDVNRLALRCIIAQPATLIARDAWDTVGGVDSALYCAMDYDLWWRLLKRFGPPCYINQYVAVNRDHRQSKTRRFRKLHYQEAIATVRKHYGFVPMKWWLAQPYAVWFKSSFG